MTIGGPVDPEIEPRDVRRPPLGAAVLVVAAGGVVGAVARVSLGAFSGDAGVRWPWPTLIVNVTGAVAIGALMVLLLARFPDALLARLFLVTGVLGGYTTFSALTVETVDLMRLDRPYLAGFYVSASVTGAALGCLLGAAAARAALRPKRNVDGVA